MNCCFDNSSCVWIRAISLFFSFKINACLCIIKHCRRKSGKYYPTLLIVCKLALASRFFDTNFDLKLKKNRLFSLSSVDCIRTGSAHRETCFCGNSLGARRRKCSSLTKAGVRQPYSHFPPIDSL